VFNVDQDRGKVLSRNSYVARLICCDAALKIGILALESGQYAVVEYNALCGIRATRLGRLDGSLTTGHLLMLRALFHPIFTAGIPMRSLFICSAVLICSSLANATTTRVSEDSAAMEANGFSFSTKASDDGRFVVFTTNATNLFAGDTNAVSDVVLKDRLTGALTCMSCTSAGAPSNGASSGGAISGDGQFVSFQSDATNLVTGDSNALTDVFVRNLATAAVELISKTAAGVQTNGNSGQSRLTTDGRYVIFGSTATNLVTGDTNGIGDIFLKDRQTGVVTRESVVTGGGEAFNTLGGGGSISSAISGDGQYIAFTSGANTMAPGDTNNLIDFFVRDRSANTTVRLTNTAGTTGSCSDPAISKDGSMVGFTSSFADLVVGDTNAAGDVFYRSRTGGTLARVTGPAGLQTDGASEVPSFNATGTKLAFDSAATNLIATDTNALGDIFVTTLGAAPSTVRISTATDGTQSALGSSTFPWMAATAEDVVYSSSARNLIANDTNNVLDVFAFTPATMDGVFANGFE
jgi:hypothetical protein